MPSVHVGVAVGQSARVLHWTHAPISQNGVAVGQSVSAEHCAHTPRGLQTGAAVGHWEPSVHATQVEVVVSQ